MREALTLHSPHLGDCNAGAALSTPTATCGDLLVDIVTRDPGGSTCPLAPSANTREPEFIGECFLGHPVRADRVALDCLDAPISEGGSTSRGNTHLVDARALRLLLIYTPIVEGKDVQDDKWGDGDQSLEAVQMEIPC